MEAVILAGGKGTRLRPFSTTIPKPLMPVGEQPILAIVLRQLKRAGTSKVVLAVNHMADLIMTFFGDGAKYGLRIEYSLEDEPLGTVAPLKLIRNLAEDFLVMNGDILTDLDYSALFETHREKKSLITIATYDRDVPVDFGVLKMDGDGTVCSFSEKPVLHLQVSTGIYVFNRRILEGIPDGRHYGFDNLVIDMLSRREQINTYHHSGYWLDLGRPDDYDLANHDIGHGVAIPEAGS